LRESKPQEVRRYTAPFAGEPIESTSPLKAADREAMQEQRRRAAAALNVCDLSERQRREAPRSAPSRSVGCCASARNRPC
jgi:hypothetical protein